VANRITNSGEREADLKTRKLLIAGLVLVLLAVYYIMGTGYLEQRREVKALASRAEEAAQMLAQIPPAPADLAERLSEAQSNYEAAQDSFPGQMNTTSIIDTVLRLADEAGVKAIPLITQPWTTENINDLNYAVFRLSVTASGDFTGLAGFIDRLETVESPTLVIESMVLERVTDITGEQVAPFEVRLEIAVYARPPAADGSEEAES
jgi:hypothetical protein